MSRTNKGSKGPGYEYWGRRYSKHEAWGRSPGEYAKKLTHKYERCEAKASTREMSQSIGEEYIGYYGGKTGRWIYDGDDQVEDLYPFSCSHPNPDNWQGDLRNGS